MRSTTSTFVMHPPHERDPLLHPLVSHRRTRRSPGRKARRESRQDYQPRPRAAPNCVPRPGVVPKRLPGGVRAAERRTVPYDDHALSWSGERNVQSPRVRQKPDCASVGRAPATAAFKTAARPRARKNHDVELATLNAVDGGELDGREGSFGPRERRRESELERGELAAVRGHDADGDGCAAVIRARADARTPRAHVQLASFRMDDPSRRSRLSATSTHAYEHPPKGTKQAFFFEFLAASSPQSPPDVPSTSFPP